MLRRRDPARRAAAPGSSRRAAREFAFRVLFESAQGGASVEDTFARATRVMREGDDTFPELDEAALDFARELTSAYATRAEEVDALLRRTIVGWSFPQMAQTDLNVLRLATAELLAGDTPPGVVIEAAVRSARKFGGDESGRFVNGVLASVQRGLPERPAKALPVQDEAEDEADGDGPDKEGPDAKDGADE